MKRLAYAGAALMLTGGAMLLPGLAPLAHAASSELTTDCATGACSGDATVTDSTPTRNETVTATNVGTNSEGENLPGSDVRGDAFSSPVFLGHATVDGSGNWHMTFKVPASLANGFHTLRFVGTSRVGTQLTESTTIQVVGGTLTPTGTNSIPWVLVGLGSMVFGGTGVAVARKRSHKA